MILIAFFIFFIILLLQAGPALMVMTASIVATPTHDNCKHVVVTTFGGYVKPFDGEVCGDQAVNLDLNKLLSQQQAEPTPAQPAPPK